MPKPVSDQGLLMSVGFLIGISVLFVGRLAWLAIPPLGHWLSGFF